MTIDAGKLNPNFLIRREIWGNVGIVAKELDVSKSELVRQGLAHVLKKNKGILNTHYERKGRII